MPFTHAVCKLKTFSSLSLRLTLHFFEKKDACTWLYTDVSIDYFVTACSVGVL